MWGVKTEVILEIIAGSFVTNCRAYTKYPRNKHTCKARNQGTTENSNIGYCTHTAGSADLKVQKYMGESSVEFRLPQIVTTE